MNIIMILLLTLSYPPTEPTQVYSKKYDHMIYIDIPIISEQENRETVDCENCDEID